MGNTTTNQSICYRTKDGHQISYVFWDMKGKQRFPEQPGDSQIDFILSRCLQQIDAPPQQIRTIKEFSTKYKYRFTVLHKRKVSEAKKEKQFEDLRRSTMQYHQVEYSKHSEQKSKVSELELMMKDVELNETMIKVALMKIDKYISQKQAQHEFIEIKGFQRLLELLDKAIKINVTGTKTNFSNQIELLKFFRVFSDRYPKDFYNYITEIRNYGSIIIKTFHPVNTHITAYCLSLLTDYLWRVEEGDHIIKILESYRLEHNFESFMSPFADTVNQTDNILMAYYNMKFINELIASVVEQDQRELLKQNLAFVKYSYILDGIKAKLEQNYFNLDNTTFISMHQKIFKYATKDNKADKQIVEHNRVSFRNTMNLNALHQQILLKLLQNDNQAQDDQNQENSDDTLIVFLGESDRKKFNKFILDTLTEVQKYSKLQFELENSGKNGDFGEETQQMVQSKIYLQNVQNYFTRIKQSCTKNNCNQIMTNCFKNLQYFQKNQWKHLERFVLEELGLERKVLDEVEELRKNLQEKETMVKRIIKQNIELRNQLAELRMKDGQTSQRSVGKLTQQSKQFLEISVEKMNHTVDQMNFTKKSALILPLPPNVNAKGKNSELPQMPASMSKFLPNLGSLPLPPTSKREQNQKPMRDRPKLNIQTRNIEIQVYEKFSTSSSNLNSSSAQLKNNTILPPPPTIGSHILPPPPPLVSSILPPPPSLGMSGLPQPPSLGLPVLPPPPSLGSMVLPPPPSLGTSVLPPPPTLGNLPPPPSFGHSLPPPPSLGSGLLPPPPPSIGSSLLPPPPPSLGTTILPPPPPMLGSTILPPPPTLGNLPPPPSMSSSMLPPPPSLGFGGLPPPPLSGLTSNLTMPGIGFMGQPAQKIKEKRKPKVPLKACNYTVIQYDKIVGTIFEEIDDTKLQFNQNQLADLFEKAAPTSKSQILSPTMEETKTKSMILGPKQSVKLLGSDRWRNAQIILTKLRIQPGQVTKTLTQCTGKFTSHSNLESILKLSPNEEEEQMIKTYDGATEDLGKPERFIKELMEIPEYYSRIKSMIFSNIKEEFYYELSSKIEQLTTAFSSLKQNKRLKQVLLICLGIGNYLNGTTLKGGAWGFKIQTIQRLEEVKSNDNKMNAAFYLVKEVWKEYPYPIFQKEEIDLYQYVSKMPVSQINQQLGQLNLYHKSVQKAFKSHNKNNLNDNFGPYCEELLMELTVKIQQYKSSSEKLNQLYLECAKYYCEDGKKIASDQFGKKMFQCILFVSNTQKMFKVIEDKRLKEQSRKALKNEVTYSEVPNPESNKKVDRKIVESVEPRKADPIKLPQPPRMPVLPLPPKVINKEQQLKKIEKIQHQRQKKALQEVMQRRTSKLQAYRMSKMSQVNTKKSVEEIDFLKGIK